MKNDILRLTAEARAAVKRIGAHAIDEAEQHRVQIDNLIKECRRLAALPMVRAAELQEMSIKLEVSEALWDQRNTTIYAAELRVPELEELLERTRRALIGQAWATMCVVALLDVDTAALKLVDAGERTRTLLQLLAPADSISPPAPPATDEDLPF